MHLTTLDWVIIVCSLSICFVPALFFGKRAGKGTAEFFASGRSVPWWLAGLSMVATTFSSDTPNFVTDVVRHQGVAGNWCWWAFVLTGVATVFFYAELWRRSGVMTDLEFYEIRYSGKAASMVRGFRAVYLGFFFNCMIMATVNLAACKIANIMFGLHSWQTLLFVGLLNVVFAAHSGLWGVLVIDMIQFFLKMSAVIAAAYFALKLPEVGGLSGMVDKLSGMKSLDGGSYLNILPDFKNHWDVAMAVFVMPIAVQWWAVWYPGSEPGGGSYIAQRMLASKSEKDALGSVLFFNVAHYCLRPWPWILVALCSVLVYPQLADIKTAFPDADPNLLGHDSAYPAMLKFLPAGWLGLMVAGLIAANSSTILTHLNWGASYLVHDFYRRFINSNASEKHYVRAGRLATVFLFICAGLLTCVLTTAKESFQIILQIGAGTGLLYLLRWFWWRINAWCEIVAMVSSFFISVVILIINRVYMGSVRASVETIIQATYANNPEVLKSKMAEAMAEAAKLQAYIPANPALVVTIIATTICWVAAAYLLPGTDEKTLIEFYRKVRPFGPGWRKIQKLVKLTPEEIAAVDNNNIPLALLGWVSGCTMIWAALFAIGNYLYNEMLFAGILFATFIVSSIALIWVVNRLWSKK
jgi:Na+/proline symporter